MKIEFANGGPADGTVQEAPDVTEFIDVYSLVSNPGKWLTEPPEAEVSTVIHRYQNAKRVSRNGHRIFDYTGGRARV